MKNIILGLLLLTSLNANACYVINGYVQCPPPPQIVYVPQPQIVYQPQPQPWVPPPPLNTGTLVK